MAYIEVLGAMGVGKTALTQLFNDRAGVRTIVEKEEDLQRIFCLEEYIADPEAYGFEGALNFLAFNLNKIREELAGTPKDACVITDTSMLMQYAYSKPVLNEDEFSVVCDIIRLAYKKLPPVDLRVVITLPPDIHLQRIRARGRDFEQGVTGERLSEVQNLLSEAVARLGRDVPVLPLDASKLDWVNNGKDKETVVQMIGRKFPALRI